MDVVVSAAGQHVSSDHLDGAAAQPHFHSLFRLTHWLPRTLSNPIGAASESLALIPAAMPTYGALLGKHVNIDISEANFESVAPAARYAMKISVKNVSMRGQRVRGISGRGQGSRLQASDGSRACSARSPGAAPPLTMLARRGLHSGRRAVLARGQGRQQLFASSTRRYPDALFSFFSRAHSHTYAPPHFAPPVPRPCHCRHAPHSHGPLDYNGLATMPVLNLLHPNLRTSAHGQHQLPGRSVAPPGFRSSDACGVWKVLSQRTDGRIDR